MAVSNILAVQVSVHSISSCEPFTDFFQGGFSFGGKALRISQKDSENGGPRRAAGHFQRSAPAAYQSPISAPTPPQSSPMSIAPPVYGSPFIYPYGSPYYYAPGSVYSDGQHFYQPPAYPGYYSYPGRPAYDTTTSGTVQVTGSPTNQSYYGYGYPGYQYSPQPYWGMTSPTAAQQPSASPAPQPPAYSTYSPPVATSTVADDRSATPTPARHDAVSTEDSLDS